jgi:hypothetical protein
MMRFFNSKILFALYLLLTMTTEASEVCQPADLSTAQSIESLSNLEKNISTCLPQYKKDYLRLFPKPEANESRDVIGFKISGTKIELDTLDEVLGIYRNKKEQLYHPTPEKWTEAVKDCIEVFCVLSKLFNSEESAMRVLNIAKKSGYVVSLGTTEIDRMPVTTNMWSASEIKTFEQALNLLPPVFYKMKSLKSFRMKKFQPYTRGSATYQPFGERIDFYDRPVNVYTILHELGHAHDYSTDSKSFGKIKGFTESDPSSFVSDYARTDEIEDYAESFAHYLMYPHELSLVSPRKYNLLKDKVFSGKEFINSELKNEIENKIDVEKIITDTIPQCLSGIRSIGLSSSIAIFEIYRTESNRKELLLKDHCYPELRAQIQSKLNKLDCNEIGVEEIESYINSRTDKVLINMLASIFASTPIKDNFKLSYNNSCLAKKDLTAKCYVDVLIKLDPKALERWGDSKAKEQMIKDLIRLTEKNDLLTGMQKPVLQQLKSAIQLPWTKTQLYLECLQAIKIISFPEEIATNKDAIVPVSPPNVEFAIVSGKSAASISKFCINTLKSKADSLGYAIDNNNTFEMIVRNSMGMDMKNSLPVFLSFDQDVLKKYHHTSKKCSSLDKDQIKVCRINNLKEAITLWAQKSGLNTDELITEKFLNDLDLKLN